MLMAAIVALPLVKYRPVMDAGPIDYGSGVPPYRQLAGALRERIRSGEFAGRKFPSDRTLAEETGLAVNTVRKAVAVLRDEGYLETHHGWGSAVRPREEWPC
jgi:GntR family transcriptional regulator